jgi:hypothetical protein
VRTDIITCDYQRLRVAGTGSWIDNEAAGTRPRFADAGRRVIAVTAPAFSESPSTDWTPVVYVKPC